MLLYGNAQNIQDQCKVYNLSSMCEGYKPLKLIPPNALGASSEIDFDKRYYDWIMTSRINFMRMFSVVKEVKEGVDVYLIISEDAWSETITESFLKMLQQRYGINATRINCIEDLFTADTGDISNPQTIYNYDNDLNEYEYVMQYIKSTSQVV